LPKARAFFIRPINKADSDGRFAVVLLVDATKDFDSGEDVEATIEPAAVRHGINMTADEHGAVGLAAESGPEIARSVGVNFDRKCFEFLLQPIAGGEPRLGEGHALSAVFIGGEAAEVFKLGDGAFGIEGTHYGALWLPFETQIG